MPDFRIDTPDSIVDFTNSGYNASDLINFDDITITGISTANEEVFTVPSPIDDLTGLNITTEKDDK